MAQYLHLDSWLFLTTGECPGFEKLKQFRNQIAHSTQTEIAENIDFEDSFRIIEDAVDLLFEGESLQDDRRHWRRVLHHIRTDDIARVKPQTKGFQAQVEKEKEMLVLLLLGRDNIIAENVAIQNISNDVENATFVSNVSSNNNNSNNNHFFKSVVYNKFYVVGSGEIGKNIKKVTGNKYQSI